MGIISIYLVVQLFILLNPLSSFPVLISAYKNKMNVRSIAINASIIALALAVIIALIGPMLFNIFGVTIDSFRIAGGIALLLLGLETIRSTGKQEDVKKIDGLISIIATPLLTGPATISFIIIKTLEIGKMDILFNILVSFVLVGAIFILFSYAIKKINPRIVEISSRVLGLFLMAMAIELIWTGIHNLILA